MDENKILNTEKNRQNQQQPAPVVMQASSPAPTPAKGKTIWLIGLLIVIILLIGATYLYQSGQQKTPPASPAASPVEVSLESELNSIRVEDIEREFSAVDQDLQSL